MLVALGVIAVHVALYVGLQMSSGRRVPDAMRAAPALVTLRLLPWTLPVPVPPRAVADRPARDLPERLRRTTGPVATPTPRPAARPWAELPTSSPPDTVDATANLPAWPASQTSQTLHQPALNLTLPPIDRRRELVRDPAIDDPRANRPRTTPEQRMARTFDTVVAEEDLGDGRRRLRRGDRCAVVTPSRVSQLMPLDDAAARTPSLVGACR